MSDAAAPDAAAPENHALETLLVKMMGNLARATSENALLLKQVRAEPRRRRTCRPAGSPHTHTGGAGARAYRRLARAGAPGPIRPRPRWRSGCHAPPHWMSFGFRGAAHSPILLFSPPQAFPFLSTTEFDTAYAAGAASTTSTSVAKRGRKRKGAAEVTPFQCPAPQKLPRRAPALPTPSASSHLPKHLTPRTPLPSSLQQGCPSS